MVAIEGRLKRAAVARSQSCNSGTHLHDCSRGLMPEHHRVYIGSATYCAFCIGMKVGSTDADCPNLDLHFTWPGICNGHLRMPECPGAMSSAALISFENDTPFPWESRVGRESCWPCLTIDLAGL